MKQTKQQAIQQLIEDKQIKIKLLKKAHYEIKNYKEDYICCALDYSSYFFQLPKYEIAAEELKEYIQKAIDFRTFFDCWQRDNNVYKNETHSRKDRLAWIRWMQSCLEEDITKLKGKLK